MRRRVGLLVLTAVLATVAAVVVSESLRSRDRTISMLLEKLKSRTMPVVVATRALPAGTKIGQGDVKIVEWPRGNVPPGAFMNAEAVFGKVVRTPVAQSEPLVAQVLVQGQETGGTLPLIIPAGMRAMSIPVNEVTDMAGMVLPHARVDVVVSVAGSAAGLGERSRIVLQNIEVLAVAHDLDSGSAPRPATVVTLQVTPGEAERLATAMRMGTLSLAMRNYADRARIRASAVDAAQLLGSPDHQANRLEVKSGRKRSRAPGRTIEVIRNGTEHQIVRLVGRRLVSGGAQGRKQPGGAQLR